MSNDVTMNVSYSLGEFVPSSEGANASMNMAIKISEQEYDELMEAAQAIQRLEPSLSFSLVERNHISLNSTFKLASFAISLGREVATPDHRELATAATASAVNWLTSMRLFLDHAEPTLSVGSGKIHPSLRGSAVRQRSPTTASLAIDSVINFGTMCNTAARRCHL